MKDNFSKQSVFQLFPGQADDWLHESIRSPLNLEEAFTKTFNSDGQVEEKWNKWLEKL